MATESKPPRVAAKMTGTVTTPKVKRPGNGPEWDALRNATTRDELAELDYKAAQIGYGESGLLRQAIADKLANLEGLSDG
jgi:hypothetical protein